MYSGPSWRSVLALAGTTEDAPYLSIPHSSRPHLRRAFVDGIAFRARQPQPFHTAILDFVGLAHFPQFAPVHFHLFTTQLDISIGLQPAAWRRHLQNGGQASSPLLDLLG
ncbi:hypothetical protein NCU16678 [Neurospora crassa OR74A]|uniref:Uncharacterized protein n=1 Tax=Neurospora crassa (strain ATCC 24698 / 74-OR23-1A / CBS 708.71 / DSM 1257 / FGSC 987) TaxID=367110 RepID=U9W524_NEUCR|nr:hypothetical protein NCU16678 [Neurospora crassa OR74A]ESA43344.1 hypothetical protein NCU16678 [Neurospora crassa OR74A]|eukprot:XP_011394052.1 hypothetical protein NCU16678 [Neurospora crassa OR74A]